MNTPTVHVRREAFLNMILSSAEIFKRECLGIIFGHSPTRSRNHFLITNVIDIKGVKVRLNKEVEQSQKSDKILKKIFEQAGSIFRPLGSFHSHPEWGPQKGVAEMGDADIKNMSTEKEKLTFIIAISSRKKGSTPWEVQPDGSVKGSLNKFNFHIAVFALIDDETGEKIPLKLRIVAPLAIKALNRAHGYS